MLKQKKIHLKIEKSFLFPSLLQDKTQLYFWVYNKKKNKNYNTI